MDLRPVVIRLGALWLVCLAIVESRKKPELSFEDRLVKEILHKYKVRGKYGRPVRKFNDTLKLEFGIQLIQIMDLNEQDQILTLNVWDQYWWTDEQVTWNITKYGGVNKVRIPWNKVWLPDIKLYNYADYRLDEKRKSLCVFHNDGRIQWVPQAVYRSSCPIDVTTFPFDIQKCDLKFGSWTYDGSKLNIVFFENKDYIDLTEYVESNAWAIIDVPANRTVQHYTCCPGEPFVDLTFTLIFQRRATLYNYILILPCVLLTSITLILFWIPPESPAKMMLGLTIFIAFFILLKILEKNLPPGSTKMPLLGTYYCLNMIILTSSSFLNVLVVNLAAYGQRATSVIPDLVKTILFNGFAKILLMEDLVRPFKKVPEPKGAEVPLTIPKEEEVDPDGKWSEDPKGSTEVLTTIKQAEQAGKLGSINAKMTELNEFIQFHKKRLSDKDRRDMLMKEYKAVALILDRIFFVIYLLMITMCLAVIIPMITYTPDRGKTMMDAAFGLVPAAR